MAYRNPTDEEDNIIRKYERLKVLQRIQSSIPSLPSGKLRESLSEAVQEELETGVSILAMQARVTELQKQVTVLEASLETSQLQVENLENQDDRQSEGEPKSLTRRVVKWSLVLAIVYIAYKFYMAM